ncbi:MAG: DNA polymerase III subunit gamma/tau [Planctomycetota bacterium]|jgi:DNA polymerase-3 subunit gamma/tau
MSDPPDNSSPLPAVPAGEYTVIARRYRPQTFEELIGQEHVAQALSNAISTSRVGHAYLFTGARGVGKTSAARILAKALNCEQGPAPIPCNQCDTCESIGSGDDVDVLEIDGASNRGIDEIRQLRQNVNVRPSRSRLKIYIIDEVHMLTREAFNALLKTLEEPPEHVKFIFCTTEPTKIPVTILSRCQRFDFAGILSGSIRERLRQIVDAEGVEAEPDALELLARRAAGSMRDAQSLLEQLLAFAPGRIAPGDVHGMLGTAGDRRLAELVGHLVDRRAAAALADLDTALGEGVGVALLLEQLFGYFRDCMAAAVGCPGEVFLYAPPGSHQEVEEVGKRLGLTTVLAVLQILEQTLSRLRYSTQGRILAELALVRICSLEDLDELSAVIAELRSADTAGRATADRPGAAPSQAARPRAGKKDPESSTAAPSGSPSAPSPEQSVLDLTPENAAGIWTRALAAASGMVVEQARQFDRVAVSGPDRLVISFKPEYALAKSFCERPEQLARLEEALAEVAGRPVRVSLAVDEEGAGAGEPAESARQGSPHQRLLEVASHPMIRRAEELFGAQPVRVDEPPDQE